MITNTSFTDWTLAESQAEVNEFADAVSALYREVRRFQMATGYPVSMVVHADGTGFLVVNDIPGPAFSNPGEGTQLLPWPQQPQPEWQAPYTAQPEPEQSTYGQTWEYYGEHGDVSPAPCHEWDEEDLPPNKNIGWCE